MRVLLELHSWQARRWRPALALGLLGLALGSAVACFSPPTDDVLFSCVVDEDERCPDDYRCEADNCCHRVGSDIEANFGACALGGNSGGTGSIDTSTSTGSETTGDTGDTDTSTDTGTDTGTDTSG